MDDITHPTESATLESLIDQHGLSAILDCLATIARAKSEHVLTNWQDGTGAKEWARAAAALDRASRATHGI